jgi:hypothetical protein
MQLLHHRCAAIVMKPEALVRRQLAFPRFGIVTIHMTEHLQHIATFVGEVLRHFYKLPAPMREAVRQQDFHSFGSLGTLCDSASHI